MDSPKIIIIAEAGVNHNGSLDKAKEMIDVAEDAGADFVKFQTFKAETLVTRAADKAEYQKKLIDKKESQFDMIKKLELNRAAHKELIDYCEDKRIRFLSTGFDNSSIDLLDELNIPLYKIPSGEITNLPYLRHIGSKGRQIVMSTGMATLKEVHTALSVLIEAGVEKDQIAVLHCNTEYPTPMKDVNLKAMITIRDNLGVRVGYSDHTMGIEIPIAAVALGATIIEKHFTLDRSQQGPDHVASLEPHELQAMVKAIRNIENALGDGIKQPSQSEIKNIHIARKSIVASKTIKKGEKFTLQNIAVKRPGTGLSPMKWDDLLGKISKNDYVLDEHINE